MGTWHPNAHSPQTPTPCSTQFPSLSYMWECFLSLTNKVEKASAAPLLCGGTGALKPILFHLSFDVINRCPLQQARCQCIIRVLHVGNNSTFAVGSGADRSPYNRYNA
eukprot:TRINITY_DN66759_c0_g1_i5.p2 TRINITY_DN66759_c0_g1~~TRINITY_DN66759_c0_g1_i5.p2  ORF type:complete len:108 (-),score=3.21 TRINITY_DN66759_c0_g1_i5:94-417(-)